MTESSLAVNHTEGGCRREGEVSRFRVCFCVDNQQKTKKKKGKLFSRWSSTSNARLLLFSLKLERGDYSKAEVKARRVCNMSRYKIVLFSLWKQEKCSGPDIYSMPILATLSRELQQTPTPCAWALTHVAKHLIHTEPSTLERVGWEEATGVQRCSRGLNVAVQLL